jgi:PncC family amidohydrolase
MKSEMAGDRTTPLYSMLLSVRDRLRDRGDRLVLAESCTAGLVAAELGQIPGISEFLCGSMVVYRTPTKTAWLGISSEILNDPAVGPVSVEVTIALARAVLEKTPEATVAAAITGHLGPSAPAGMDGQLYCAMVRRDAASDRLEVQSLKITSPSVTDLEDLAGRGARQKEAALGLLGFLEKKL